MVYLMLVVPGIIVPYAVTDRAPSQIMWELALPVAASFLLLTLVARVSLVRLPVAGLDPRMYLELLLMSSTVTSIGLLLYFGVPTALPNPLNPYGVRLAYRAAVDSLPAMLRYMVLWQANVVNPLLLVLSLERRRPVWAVVSIVGQLVVYGHSGFKTVLFAPLVAVVVWWMLGRGLRARSASATLVGGSLAASILAFGVFRDLLVPTFLFRRLTAVPGLLLGYYYEYFSTHPTLGLSQSILKGLTHSPYATPAPFVIGAQYFSNPDVSANAGFLADGFANFGVPGMFFAAALVGLAVQLLRNVGRGVPERVSVAVALMPGFALVNSAALTVLLTHGLGLAIVVLYLYPARWRRSKELSPTFAPMEQSQDRAREELACD